MLKFFGLGSFSSSSPTTRQFPASATPLLPMQPGPGVELSAQKTLDLSLPRAPRLEAARVLLAHAAAKCDPAKPLDQILQGAQAILAEAFISGDSALGKEARLVFWRHFQLVENSGSSAQRLACTVGLAFAAQVQRDYGFAAAYFERAKGLNKLILGKLREQRRTNVRLRTLLNPPSSIRKALLAPVGFVSLRLGNQERKPSLGEFCEAVNQAFKEVHREIWGVKAQVCDYTEHLAWITARVGAGKRNVNRDSAALVDLLEVDRTKRPLDLRDRFVRPSFDAIQKLQGDYSDGKLDRQKLIAVAEAIRFAWFEKNTWVCAPVSARASKEPSLAEFSHQALALDRQIAKGRYDAWAATAAWRHLEITLIGLRCLERWFNLKLGSSEAIAQFKDELPGANAPLPVERARRIMKAK